MVKIKLDELYTLSSDQNQWILLKKSGKEFKHIRYYISMSSCLNDYYQISLRTSPATSFEELIIISKELRKRLEDVLRPLESIKI